MKHVRSECTDTPWLHRVARFLTCLPWNWMTLHSWSSDRTQKLRVCPENMNINHRARWEQCHGGTIFFPPSYTVSLRRTRSHSRTLMSLQERARHSHWWFGQNKSVPETLELDKLCGATLWMLVLCLFFTALSVCKGGQVCLFCLLTAYHPFLVKASWLFFFFSALKVN